jgi:hypothetical protein
MSQTTMPPNHAQQRTRPILVTTNHSGEAMEKLFSENVAAPLILRLRDDCDCFAFEQGSEVRTPASRRGLTHHVKGIVSVKYEADFLLGGLTMRPVRPEPEERPKIKRAMRAARFMKWGAQPLFGLAMVAAIVTGATTAWYYGVAVFVVTWGPLFIVGYSVARCPHCGQVWWPITQLGNPPWYPTPESPVMDDETETMVCRRCRLDIGPGLRE